MKTTIKLIIADDHDLILDGLQILLKHEAQIQIVGVAKNGQMLTDLALQLRPDVILTDIKMPIVDGITATKIILEHIPSVKVIALTFMDSERSVVQMLEAGALGYIIKNASKHEIISAIFSVHNGASYYCEYTSPILKTLIARSEFDPFQQKRKVIFDEREKQILRLICKEKTNQEIAETLFLSTRTVEWYRLNLQKKLNVRNVAGLIIYAIKTGLVDLY